MSQLTQIIYHNNPQMETFIRKGDWVGGLDEFNFSNKNRYWTYLNSNSLVIAVFIYGENQNLIESGIAQVENSTKFLPSFFEKIKEKSTDGRAEVFVIKNDRSFDFSSYKAKQIVFNHLKISKDSKDLFYSMAGIDKNTLTVVIEKAEEKKS